MDKSLFNFLLGEDQEFKALFDGINKSIEQRVEQLNNYSDLSQFAIQQTSSNSNIDTLNSFIKNNIPDKYKHFYNCLNENEIFLLHRLLQVQSLEHGKERFFAYMTKMFIDNILKISTTIRVEFDTKYLNKIEQEHITKLGQKKSKLGLNQGVDAFIIGKTINIKSNLALVEIGPISYHNYLALKKIGWGDNRDNNKLQEMANCFLPFNYTLNIKFIISKKYFVLAQGTLAYDSLNYKYV